MGKKKPSKCLLEKVSTSQNLHSAWKELNKSNPLSRGLSEETIQSFGASLNSNFKKIRLQLKSDEYNFLETKGVIIQEKVKSTGKIKKRPLQISEIPDRLIQRAIVRKIDKILDKEFHLRNEASFAYLKGSGVRDALKVMLQLYKQKYNICFEADIENFFDTIDKKRLINKNFSALPDKSLNRLINSALSQKVGNIVNFSEEDQSFFMSDGIPQGGALSPLFANIYLSDFDKIMLKKGFHLIRYADDFIVMCKTRKEAEEAYVASKNILEKKLGLQMHPLGDDDKAKTRILTVGSKSLNFLGNTFTGALIQPQKKTVSKLEDKIKEITQYRKDQTLLTVLRKIYNLLDGWISSYCHAEIEYVIDKIYPILYERLGVFGYKIQWLEKRKPINYEQYQNAGLPDLKSVLSDRRKSLMKHKRDYRIFKDFWKSAKKNPMGSSLEI